MRRSKVERAAERKSRHPMTTVLLAGTLRATPLREALDQSILGLTLGNSGTVLDAWIAALETIGATGDVRIVVNAGSDVNAISGLVHRIETTADRRMRIIVEPAAWRGASGIAYDVTRDVEGGTVVIAEASALPPADLRPLTDALQGDVIGVVGVAGALEPAGVYAFAFEALEHVPAIGYHDLKEQLLPSLAANDRAVVTATIGERVIRLRDRGGYLDAVHEILERGAGAARRVVPTARVAPSSVLDGFTLVGERAVVEEGAVVHDSIVLAGACIGRDAVISRSVIGPGTVVADGEHVVREIRSGSTAAAAGYAVARSA
jgi:hypothetical protein